MGAWGYKAFDNDSALDWLFEIDKPMVRTILATFKSVKTTKRGIDCNYHEGIAAAQLLLDHCRKSHYPDLTYEAMRAGVFAWGLLAIDKILKDAGWIAGWKSPKDVERMLRSLRRALRTRLTVETKRREKIRLRIVTRRIKYARRRPRKKEAA